MFKVLEKPIPEQLKSLNRWCLFRREQKSTGGKPTKRPITTGNSAASSTDAATWTTFDAALAALNRPEFEADGLNLATGGDGDPVIAAFDFDGAVSDDGMVDPRIEQIVAEVGSYAEFSPSGSGIRIWCRAPAGTESISRPKDGFEFAAGRHFFSVTGNALQPGLPSVLTTIDAETPRRLYEQFIAPPEPQESTPQAAERHETQPEQPEEPKPRDAGESHHDDAGESAVAAAVRRCLEALADWRADDRGAWIEVLCTLRNTEAEHGLELRDQWHAFSRRSDKYSAADADRVWDQFEVRGADDRRLGLGSLLRWAAEDSGIPVEQLAGTFQIKSESSATAPSSSGYTWHTQIVPASRLEDLCPGDISWIWDGYIAKGLLTLLVAAHKTGKSTLLGYAMREMEHGGHLAGQIAAAKTLVVSEEPAPVLRERRDRIGLRDHVEFHIKPFRGRPSAADWRAYCEWLVSECQRRGVELLILDTWQKISPVIDENNNVEVKDAIENIRRISDAGPAVVIVHHARKGETAAGEAARGASSILGEVDIIAELRRHGSDKQTRSLFGVGRLGDGPGRRLLRLENGVYREVADEAEADLVHETVIEILAALQPGESLSQSEILARWPAGVYQVHDNRMRDKLSAAVAAGQIHREAAYTGRSKTYRYSLPRGCQFE